MTYPPQDPYGQQQGGYGYGNNPGPAPDNYLVWAILTTILCCLPLGIVSIVKSSQVNGLWMSGQYDQARQAANAAKKWAMWSAIGAAIFWVLYILFFVVLGFALFSQIPDNLPPDLTNFPTNFPIPTT